MNMVQRVIVCVFLLVFLTQCNNPKPVELKDMPSRYASTFQMTTPDRVIIDDYTKLSDTIPARTHEMKDSVEVKKMMALLFQLPDSGEIMIKMGDVPLKRVNLVFSDHIEMIEFYNGRIKTPATSFYAQPNPMEQAVFDLVSRDSL
ncbi:hypothetical protein [Pseudochryseolinea flava]|nr:hypothetical protein [Pseudochryseolinea flava]